MLWLFGTFAARKIETDLQEESHLWHLQWTLSPLDSFWFSLDTTSGQRPTLWFSPPWMWMSFAHFLSACPLPEKNKRRGVSWSTQRLEQIKAHGDSRRNGASSLVMLLRWDSHRQWFCPAWPGLFHRVKERAGLTQSSWQCTGRLSWARCLSDYSR